MIFHAFSNVISEMLLQLEFFGDFLDRTSRLGWGASSVQVTFTKFRDFKISKIVFLVKSVDCGGKVNLIDGGYFYYFSENKNGRFWPLS